MDNSALRNEVEETDVQEQEIFTIDNDDKAEWALKKISEEQAEMNRLIMVCKNAIAQYEKKIEAYTQKNNQHNEYLKSLLRSYFNTVNRKKSKTQETYELPSGKLKLKFREPEFAKDDKILGKFLKDNDYKEFYEEVVKPKWAELKKTIVVKDENIIDKETGVIIEGVTALERDPEFTVEV